MVTMVSHLYTTLCEKFTFFTWWTGGECIRRECRDLQDALDVAAPPVVEVQTGVDIGWIDETIMQGRFGCGGSEIDHQRSGYIPVRFQWS